MNPTSPSLPSLANTVASTDPSMPTTPQTSPGPSTPRAKQDADENEEDENDVNGHSTMNGIKEGAELDRDVSSDVFSFPHPNGGIDNRSALDAELGEEQL